MKLPPETNKSLRVSIEDRSQPKAETRKSITVNEVPDIRTMTDGQMVINSGNGYVRTRSNVNRMLMVDVDSMSTVEYYDGEGIDESTTDIANKLNEVIEALKLLGAIK